MARRGNSQGLQFTYRSNATAAVEEVRRLGVRIADPRMVLEDFAEHMLNTSLPANFEAGGRPDKWKRSAWSSENQQKESGRLMRSIQKRVQKRGVEFGTNLIYARQRHFGGVLKPKKAKALAVPVAGLSRAMRRPRRWGDRLKFIPSKTPGGNTVGVLATKERNTRSARKGGAGKWKWVAQFILRKEVTQEPRPFLLFQDDDMAYVSRRMIEYAATGGLR